MVFGVPRGDLHLGRQRRALVVQLPEEDGGVPKSLGVDRRDIGGEVDGVGGTGGCWAAIQQIVCVYRLYLILVQVS